MQINRHFPVVIHSHPIIARRLVREALSDWPRADDLMIAVTELGTNGISHSASGQDGSFTVRLRTAPGWARIEITDDGPAADDPSPRHGWGLAIVAGVTDRASAVIQPDGCRTAWCEVSWPSPEPDDQLGRLSGVADRRARAGLPGALG